MKIKSNKMTVNEIIIEQLCFLELLISKEPKTKRLKHVKFLNQTTADMLYRYIKEASNEKG